jgi:hypothetical protein
MGADSMTTVSAGNQLVSYANANKVHQIDELPIVAMTFGLGGLGRRTVQSLIAEWCEQRPDYEASGYTVQGVASDLFDWFFSRHAPFLEATRTQMDQVREIQRQCKEKGEAMPPGVPEVPIPQFDPLAWRTGLIVGGYQPGSHFPWLYAREQPNWPGASDQIIDVRPHQVQSDGSDLGPAHGVNWWGIGTAVFRLVKGYDHEIFGKLRAQGLVAASDANLANALGSSEWPVAYEGMPIKDAAELVRFLLSVGSGYEQFKAGLALIGGGLDIAILTRKNVYWYSRKELTEAMAEAMKGVL